MTWHEAFLWTLGLELPLYALVLRRSLSIRGFFLATLGGNAFTHPIVWNTVLRFSDYDTGFRVMETFAVLAETGIVALALVVTRRGLDPSARPSDPAIAARAFVAALSANAFSALVGPRLIDWVSGQ